MRKSPFQTPQGLSRLRPISAQARSQVVFKYDQADLFNRRPDGSKLNQEIGAISILVDHSAYRPNMTLDPR